MEQHKKKFLKNMVGFSLTTWIAFVIGLIASPIATRLFPTDEMGRLNLFFTYASLFSATCYLGLDQAFVRFYNEPPARGDRSGLFTFCVATSLAMGLLVTLAGLIFWKPISAQVMDAPNLSVYLCLALYSLSLILFRYLSLSYRMAQNARLYTVQGVMQIVIIKLGYLTAAFRSARALPAIWLVTAMLLVFVAVFAFVQRGRFTRDMLRQADAPFVREVSKFAAPLIPLAVMAWLNSYVSLVVLRNLMSVSAVGVYSSGLVLASTVNLIQTGFNTYWAPYVYENYQRDDKRRFFTVHRLMACLLTGFGLTLTLLQTPVYLLLGHAYRGSAVYFPFLFFTPICYCLSETTGMGIGIAKKSYWNTLIFLISAVVNIALCYLLIPIFQDAGAAMAAAGAALTALFIRTAAGEKYYKAIEHYRYLYYAVGLMLTASVGNYALRSAPLLKYALLAGVWALAVFLFRAEVRTLLDTARQVLREGAGALKRRAAGKHGEGDPT